MMTLNKRNFSFSLLSLILGVSLLFVMSPTDPLYLRIIMPIASTFSLVAGLFGIYKSIKR